MFLDSANNILIISIIISTIIIIGIISYFFSTKQKIIRTLAKLPIQQVGNFRTNEFTKFTGKALPIKEPLIAPYSQQKCVFYGIKIEHKKSNGKTSHWKTIAKEEKIQEFFLENNNNFLIVKTSQNPKNYISHVIVDKKISSGTFKDPSPEFKTILKRYNIKSDGYFGFKKSLRYTESIIEINKQITVAGFAKWKNLNKTIKDYSYSKITVLESSDTQKLIITDLPNLKPKKRL